MEEDSVISNVKEYVDKEYLSSLITTLETKIADVENKMASLESCYPVGGIYISVSSTAPSTLFGFGSWTKIENRFLLGAGSSYNAGSTGGASTVALSTTQVPNVHGTVTLHSIGVATNIHGTEGCFASGYTNSDNYRDGGTQASGASSIGQLVFDNGGTGAAHNNMPPYLAVYMFRRVS